MSLYEKIQEIRNADAASRRDFTPNGRWLEVYQGWVHRGGKKPSVVNFCHFWRVVLFFAHTRRAWFWLKSHRHLLGEIMIGVVLLAIVSASIVTVVLHPWLPLEIVGAAVLLVYGRYGLTKWLKHNLGEIEDWIFPDGDYYGQWRNRWLKRHEWVNAALVFPLLPFALIGAAFGLLVCLAILLIRIKDLLRDQESARTTFAVMIISTFLLLLVVPATRSMGTQALLMLSAFAAAMALLFLFLVAMVLIKEYCDEHSKDLELLLVFRESKGDIDGQVLPLAPPRRSWPVKMISAFAEFCVLLWNILLTGKHRICPLVPALSAPPDASDSGEPDSLSPA